MNKFIRIFGAPIIALLIIGLVFLVSYSTYNIGYNNGVSRKGTWHKETRIDTIITWKFKPE